jgi:2-polyprenyl-3-methyl-5-hydroxy-6-metoxy-1,4-benzoquinol methylase
MSLPCLLGCQADTRRLFVKGGKTFMRCTACGLEWLEPMPTPGEASRYYAESYREGLYTAYAKADEIRTLIARHRLAVVQSVARPGRWLDVGCGTGHFVTAAVGAGIDAEGLDVSPAAVAAARARGLTAHVSRVEEFAPSVPYDAITAFDVIEHTLDPGLFLDRLRTWLAPGGTLVMTLPDVTSIYPRLLMRRHWFYYAPSDHLYYFGPRTLTRLLEQHGFTARRIMRAYKPMTLRYIVGQLELFNPVLGRILRPLTGALPRQLLTRPWRCYLGEMTAVAS